MEDSTIIRVLATQKGREVVAAGILAATAITAVAINSDKFPTIDLPVRRDGASSNVQLNPMMLNSGNNEANNSSNVNNSGTRRKNRLPDKGQPNTTEPNALGTTTKVYGPDGNVQKEYKKGHRVS